MTSFFNEYFSERFPLPSNEKVDVVVEEPIETETIKQQIPIIPDNFNNSEKKAIYDLIIERFLINLLDILLDSNIELNKSMLTKYSFDSLPVEEIKTDLMIDFNSFLAMLFDHINFEIMFLQIIRELDNAYVKSGKTQQEKNNRSLMINTFKKPSYQFSGIDPNLLPRIVSLLNNQKINGLTDLTDRFIQILNNLITQKNYDLFISCINDNNTNPMIINCVKNKIIYPLNNINEVDPNYKIFKNNNVNLIKNLVSYYTLKIKNIDYWNFIKKNIGEEKMKNFHLNNPFYNETKVILNKYPIHNMGHPDYYETIKEMNKNGTITIYYGSYESEFKGGKRKKTCKNRKGKKCRKTNKKQKKKSLAKRKNKGRKTRRKN